MDKMERQRQIESDSVRDGCVRWCQGTMDRFENWIASPTREAVEDVKVERILMKMETAYVRPTGREEVDAPERPDDE